MNETIDHDYTNGHEVYARINKRLAPHGVQFVRWIRHRNGKRTLVLRKI